MMTALRSWPVILLLLAPLVLVAPGCGESPTFNKDAEYTPESLAQELVSRYNALSPTGKTSKRARRPEKKAVGTKADGSARREFSKPRPWPRKHSPRPSTTSSMRSR